MLTAIVLHLEVDEGLSLRRPARNETRTDGLIHDMVALHSGRKYLDVLDKAVGAQFLHRRSHVGPKQVIAMLAHQGFGDAVQTAKGFGHRDAALVEQSPK